MARRAPDAIFRKFEKVAGLRIPDEMLAFFRKPRRLKWFDETSAEEVCLLTRFYPAVALRVVPLLSTRCGDFMGLYFPRGGGKPFVVDFHHEESFIAPVTSDLSAFFANPDVYSPDCPERESRHAVHDRRAWRRLLVNVHTAGEPEMELLKPFALQFRRVEENDASWFAPLFERFGSTDQVARVVRQAFERPLDLLSRRKWVRLAKQLGRLERWDLAIQALDNSLAIHFVYPYYGEAPRNGHARWGTVAEVFELLTPVVDAHGDHLDRILVHRGLRMAKQWSREVG